MKRPNASLPVGSRPVRSGHMTKLDIERERRAVMAHAITEPRPPSDELLVYLEIVKEIPARVDLACGIDARGPWATLSGYGARAATPADALRAVLAKWRAAHAG